MYFLDACKKLLDFPHLQTTASRNKCRCLSIQESSKMQELEVAFRSLALNVPKLASGGI
jgi:hypothetical protein